MIDDSLRTPLLDLELLRTFDAVVRLGSFTAAAERLHRTQSTVSAQLRRLEELTDRRLMERNNQGVALTPAGETLLAHARSLLRLNAEALAELGAHDVTGTVRLGAPADYLATFLAGALPAFGRAYPGVELEVHCDLSGSLRDELARGQLDVVIGSYDPAEVAEGEVLRSEPLVWAGAEAGDAWRRDPLPLALFPPSCRFRQVALARLAAAGRTPRVAYTSPGMSGIEAAVGVDFAVAPVTRSSIRPPLRELGAAEGLPALPRVDVTLHRGVALSEPAALLAAHIRAHAAGAG